MPNPFPGMNPYLEQADVWANFHDSMILAIRDALTPQLRPHFYATSQEHVYIHELPADQWRMLGRPDVALSVSPYRSDVRSAAIAQTSTATAQVELIDAVDEIRSSYLEIRDRRQQKVVSVLELLSPSNKQRGPDREQYLLKRRRVLRSSAHFIEIDLLRGGPRMPPFQPSECDYLFLVSRAEQRPKSDVWHWKIRDALPKLPIPLAEGINDAVIDLQEILNDVFDRGGFDMFIYSSHPEPPLSQEDAAWASGLITSPSAAAGLSAAEVS